MKPVIFLMGPTASGKTDVAAALCETQQVELVSVDAAQVYRGMNIGTAKPDSSFLTKYPHHLIDILNPDATFSAADFVDRSRDLIVKIQNRGNIPLFVGGTMFYFSALENGLSNLPESDQQIREQLIREEDDTNLASLYEKLSGIDPAMAAKIEPADRQRIHRALEIFKLSGQPPSSLMNSSVRLRNPLLKITLFEPERQRLHQRISDRFSGMVAQGLIDEVESLLNQWPGLRERPSMRTVGYRQVIQFLDNQINREEMMSRAIAATRQLAKRQLTWLRQQRDVVWFNRESVGLEMLISGYMRQWADTVGVTAKG